MKMKIRRLTQTQMIVVGYLLIILIGAMLLMLPAASRDGKVTPFIDALFTSASASCVTGLVVADTYQKWTMFGQCVILLLIQIGGLGFMTIGVFFAIILHRKIGLVMRGTLQESVNIQQIGGIVRLAKKIMQGTLVFEGTGAVILALRFQKDFGWVRGIYYGIFHSISAFCNAGFDLMGTREAYSSFTWYDGDPVINIVIMFLIIIGGIGFFVWNDVAIHKFHVTRYRLHTKIVLTTTAILIVSGAILLYLFEADRTLAGMSGSEKIFCSLFGSVTARTAGFNTVDTAALSDSSKIVTILLMFIGGSPGSTSGGIKTTTFVVLLVYVSANLKNEDSCHIFGRRLDEGSIRKASTVMCTNLFLIVAAVMILTAIQQEPVMDIVFEVVSAIGTVGMSTGMTRGLTGISKWVIIFLMYCGRVGGLTFALSLRGHRAKSPLKEPVEAITIG